MSIKGITALIISALIFADYCYSQISPGDLAEPHAHLEGMSNCTQCHILGDKVSNEKCLKCHDDIKARMELGKGYHASEDVKSKECVVCHNDHHGRNFQIIRFSEETFNHRLTGYELLGAHAGKTCKSCHKPEFISDPKIKSKKYTYLGLDPACASCHEDYHQGTLSRECNNCHGFDKFKPADKFDHNRSLFPLAGKHALVECGKCHKTVTKDGREFREFKGIVFNSCASCHADVHKGQFGLDCRQCHNEESFHIVKGMDHFDHNKTGYPLLGRHQAVDCKKCHKTNLTDPLKYNLCMDCHADYHNDQFKRETSKPDCSQCHSTSGFSGSSFTIEQHNAGQFKLEGAHLATPCFACHKKETRWEFRNIGIRCHECHKDIHQPFLDAKYYGETGCAGCHNSNSWHGVYFDHSKTQFKLEGAHLKQTCSACHFRKGEDGLVRQQFVNLGTTCVNCHKDTHAGQFQEKGIKDCRTCHAFDNWKAVNFDHSKTKFPLDGKHAGVACNKCHKEVINEQVKYIQYTYKEFKCETCHR